MGYALMMSLSLENLHGPFSIISLSLKNLYGAFSMMFLPQENLPGHFNDVPTTAEIT